MRHHYVPQWFQRNFLNSPTDLLQYLDLHPKPITVSNKIQLRDRSGNYIFHRNPRKLHTNSCFYENDLYDRFPHDEEAVDDSFETVFLRDVDRQCSTSWNDISKNSLNIHNLFFAALFLATQFMRTPRGLNWFATLRLRIDPDIPYVTFKMILPELEKMKFYNIANWSSMIWEHARYDKNDIEFIISDNVVTFYNPIYDPRTWLCRFPEDPSDLLVGTRVFFPVGPRDIIILSNADLYFQHRVRQDAHRQKIFQSKDSGIINEVQIINDRTLSYNDVLSINYIMKQRAMRYIGSQKIQHLYPEKQMKTRVWNKLEPAFKPNIPHDLYSFLKSFEDDAHILKNMRHIRRVPTRYARRKYKPHKWRGLPV